jgi:hypothetical protein
VSYLKSGDGDRAEGRLGHVEEERLLRLDDRGGDGLPQAGRRAKAPRAGGWQRASDRQQRDARVGFETDWGERWRAGQIGKGESAS